MRVTIPVPVSLAVAVRMIAVGALALVQLACEPLWNVQGAFFPAWAICLVVGVALTFASRAIFARVGLEPHLGPLAIVYPCLALSLTLATWLIFFRA